MENYFNYFTEIEEHFLRRRGGGLLLSTLDWALIETWKDAGIPLQAALRGIDEAFDRYDQRSSKSKKINSLAYCSQAVLSAAEDMKEAAVGAESATENASENVAENVSPSSRADLAPQSRSGQGFEPEAVASFLRRNAELLAAAKLPDRGGVSMHTLAIDAAHALRKMADETEEKRTHFRLEDLERHLTVLEEKVLAALIAASPDEEIVNVRSAADRDLAPYRRKMPAAQIDQLHKQYLYKRLLEKYALPRLSLFYM